MSDARELLLSRTREVPDFPEPGVLFKDVTPLFADSRAFDVVIEEFCSTWRERVDAVVGIEARGFILGPPIALSLALPFVPIRKAGKLPGAVHSKTYELEYGTATLEIQTDAVTSGQRVLVVDDVLATGGTAAAAGSLVQDCGAVVAGFAFLMELGALRGREVLEHDVHVVATV